MHNMGEVGTRNPTHDHSNMDQFHIMLRLHTMIRLPGVLFQLGDMPSSPGVVLLGSSQILLSRDTG